ncbi:hypothetical protein TWF481_003162 [Arthrobotrys musiformis]|uniref:Mid2 domain-containing protein n=1 Tax=Arthrobotrys musiformis TaxID=47236 RepID=A0AAV9VRM2_9PEZI
MPGPKIIAISLSLSHLFTTATAQFATAYSFTQFSTTPLATYSFGGSLENFNPPADCTVGDVYSASTEIFLDTSTATSRQIWSWLSAGCHSDGPRSCCPTNWGETLYYTSTGGSCPPGYSRMPSATTEFFTVGTVYYYPVISLTSGTKAAFPCCPTISYTHLRASTSGVALPRIMLTTTLTTSSTREYVKALCNYLQSDNLEVFLSSSLTYSIFRRYLANPIYIFDDDAVFNEVTTTTSSGGTDPTSSPPSTPASPGVSATTSTEPSKSAIAGGDEGEGSGDGKKSGLSTGAIVGIAVGVAVPVLLIAIYLTYRFTRKASGAVGGGAAAGGSWGKSNKTEVGAMEPGIMENPAEYGGIHGGSKA